MATLSHSESRRLYSWWWDSHISPKNSKWLQDNLTDMDAKVKAMIKLIEEDADSFARRAEMYYKKRPELMKLVEEFYRAYRALAERYNHATGELRQAHRTIAEAFPNQDSFSVNDDMSQSSESHTPVSPHPNHSFFDPDDLHKDVHWLYSSNLHGLKRGASADESDLVVGRKGLKQLNEMFKSREALSEDPKLVDVRKPQSVNQQGEPDRGQNLKEESRNLKKQTPNDPKRAVNAVMDLQTMREALSKMVAERDAVLLQYKQSLKKLADLEKQLGLAQKNARELDQQSSKAVAEIKELKEALGKSEAERDANLIRYTESLQMVSTLETTIVAAQEDARGLSERAVKAETESEYLKQELSRSVAEQEARRLLYEQSLEKISALEAKMSLVEGNAKLLSDRSNKAENEVKALREELFRSNEMKEDVALWYKECLETISKLQNELRAAQEETGRLNNENLLGAAKLKGAEDQCVLLDRMNQSLLSDAEILAQKIAAKDHELSEKHSELEKLQISLQDEHSRFVQVEATLRALQDLHSRSQEEQSNLALELRNGLQKLKDLEISKHDLETEVDRLKEENCSLNDLNLATCTSEKNLQNEIASLRQMKEKLENEVRRQEEQNDALHQQAVLLKEEIEDLRHRYQAIIQEVLSSGLEPESLSSSVRHLQDENSRLKQVSCDQRAEREALLKKLDGMEDLLKKSAFLESCLSDVNADLERSKSKMKVLKQSCQLLSGDKSTLAGEKSALLSQLQITTENMQKLLEKNAMLENSLSRANAELEGLREKSKGLEEFCQFLNSEKSSLLAERSNLISRLENVEKKLENMETRFSILEDKYGALEKEKESTLTQVEELRVSLVVEKQERASLVLTNETRLSGLEDRIHHLQAENSYRKKDFEEQLDKAVNAQVEIIILQKFLHDMEDKNYYLLTECQKHMEAIQYSENLISELESENMMHQVETEFLLDRINKLRAGICQVLKALEMSHISETEPEQNFLPCILANIRDNRKSLLDSRNENLQLLVENSILTTLLGQLKLEGSGLESQMKAVSRDFLLLSQKHAVLETENCKILERSRQLDIEIVERERREEMLNAEMASLLDKQAELQGEYAVLEYEQVNASQENSNLRKEFSELQKEKCISEEENRTVLSEALAIACQCEVFKNYGLEKALDLCAVSDKMEGLRKAYDGLEHEAVALSEKHLMKEIENLHLWQCAEKSEEDKHKLKECNDRLKLQISAEKELLDHKSTQLSEAMQELRLTQDKVTDLCRTVKGLENKQEELEITRENLENQVIELSCKNKSQEKEIIQIRKDNAKLESEAGTLHEEIEEHKIREAVLSSELQERSSEFELWEAEAASFYFDFQISTVREVLYENKVHELSEGLEDVSSRSSTEIERTKQRVHSLEGEAEGLRAQLAAYAPIIISLKENVSSLEKNLNLQSKHQLPNHPERQVVASTAHSDYSGVQDTSEESCTETGVTELQNLQARIMAIESALAEQMENVAVQERANSSKKLEAASKQIEELQSVITSHQAEHLQKQERKLEASQYNHRKSPEQTAEISEVRNVTQMKDIPLDHVSGGGSLHVSSRKGIRRPDDQMLELWESAEHESDHDLILRKLDKHISSSRRHDTANHLSRFGRRSRTNPVPESEIEKELGVDKLEVSNQDDNKKGILERLTGDSEKLMSLQVSVQELRSKMDTGKKKKNTKNFEYDRLRSQLQEAENTLIQLMDTNTEIMRMVEDESPITCNENLQIKRVAEQARRGSEKIGKLQLEMQTIQYLLLKMEDEKKGKSRFSTSRTGIMMREFVYRREKDDKKKKKGRFCSCIRSSSSSIDN